MSVPPALVLDPAPSSVAPPNEPVTHKSPDRSTAMAPGVLTPEPPHPLAHITEPFAPESLASAKLPLLAPLFRVMLPKAMLEEINVAAINTLPLPSTATPQPLSPCVPPNCLTHK